MDAPTIDLPISEDMAGLLMHELGVDADPDRPRVSVEIVAGDIKALGRWYAYAVRQQSKPGGGSQCWVSLAWMGQD
jgi:hypothetical protein